MPTETPPPELGNRLGYLFKHASRLLEQRHASALAPFGVDGRELGVLIVLAAGEPASQHEVAKRMSVDRTTMVAMLDTLEKKGLVGRHPHAQDRRRNVVELTPRGLEVVAGAKQASDEAERSLLAPLTDKDQREFRRALALIVHTPKP